MEQWAGIRRLRRVDGVSVREISRRTGLHRKTIRRALASTDPPRYSAGGSKADPFKDWICGAFLRWFITSTSRRAGVHYPHS